MPLQLLLLLLQSASNLTSNVSVADSPVESLPPCRMTNSELDSDPAANLLVSASEEAQKVARNEGKVRQHLRAQLLAVSV